MGTPVHRHDARIVNHLCENRDRVARLHELDVVVVDAWQERRPRGGPLEAPLVQGQILRPFSNAAIAPDQNTRPMTDASRIAGLSSRGRASIRAARRAWIDGGT